MLHQRLRKRRRPGVLPLHPNPGSRLGVATVGRFAVSPMRLAVKRTYVFCHYCGYTPKGNRTDLPCPKCYRHAWECGSVAEKLVPQED